MNESIKRINGHITSTQYDEATINAARAEWDAARTELDNVLDAADDYITANGYERVPGHFSPKSDDAKGQAIQHFRYEMDEPSINPLTQTVNRYGYEIPRKHRYTNEAQPVGKALKEAAKLRNLAKKLSKLVSS